MEQKLEAAVWHRPKWYHHHLFSLLPHYEYWEGNDQNPWSIRFHWLVFRLWTNISPQFGFGVHYNSGQLEFRLDLPYTHTGLFIPIMPHNWDYKLWRKSRVSRGLK